MIWRRAPVALLCLATMLSGASDAAWDSAWAGGVLRRTSAAEPATLDPLKTAGLNERGIVLDLFEGLTTYAADGRMVPGVATDWQVSEDGHLWTFHLRHDARWSNGDPLTSE